LGKEISQRLIQGGEFFEKRGKQAGKKQKQGRAEGFEKRKEENI
jgi:hypothetical protein